MTPERRRRAEALFQAVLAHEPELRAAYLAEVCADDPGLRDQVAALLKAHERAVDPRTMPGAADSPPDDRPEPAGGQVIGHYEVVRPLGRGGMGAVYLARDTQLDRRVALKLLHAHFTTDADRVRRFRREARAVSALNHPNILTIYEVGRAGEIHFIATEFIEGETLRAAIRGGGLTLGAVLDMAIQAVGAVAAAHEAGIIHRDLKPENLMVRPDGLVKVLDFGVAKLAERPLRAPPPDADLVTADTEPGVVIGTINYMSPEQARGLDVDARTDIFSLGVMLYELITGAVPFAGATTGDVIVSILCQEPPPLARRSPKVPDRLQQIVSRALAKEREQRYQRAAELLGELKGLKQELEWASKSKRPDAAASSEVTLSLPVGGRAAVAGDLQTLTTAGAGRRTSSVKRFIGRVKRGRKAVALALAAPALLLAGMFAGQHLLTGRAPAVDSIAVLPFVNAGADPQAEYLPDGITESIINSLSQLPQLRVMARSTVFSYQGQSVDPRQVGAALGVRAVVTGRVRKRDEALTIVAELVDVSDGSRLWGAQYDRRSADILAVQAEIAREIAATLRLRLSGDQQRQLAKRFAGDSEAYQLYLKGRYYQYQFTRESGEGALAYFTQAIAADPSLALAYAGVADIYSDFSSQYLPPGEAMPRAKAAALRALELDDTLAEAHQSLAAIRWWGDWDGPGAERAFKRAIELNPNFAMARTYHAEFLTQQGRFDEALAEAHRAQQLDPLSPHTGDVLNNIYYFARQYDRAIEECRKAIVLNPGYARAHLTLGRAYRQKAMYLEAAAELSQALALNRHDQYLSELAHVYAVSGRRGEALRIINELEGQAARRQVSPVYIAKIYAGLGDKDRAFEWLRRGYAERSDHLVSLRVDPAYDSLRSDPRFVDLLRGVGLAP